MSANNNNGHEKVNTVINNILKVNCVIVEYKHFFYDLNKSKFQVSYIHLYQFKPRR